MPDQKTAPAPAPAPKFTVHDLLTALDSSNCKWWVEARAGETSLLRPDLACHIALEPYHNGPVPRRTRRTKLRNGKQEVTPGKPKQQHYALILGGIKAKVHVDDVDLLNRVGERARKCIVRATLNAAERLISKEENKDGTKDSQR